VPAHRSPLFVVSTSLFLLAGLASRAAADAQGATPPGWIDAIRAWRAEHEREIVGELADLLAIPNRSSDAANIERNAAAIAALLGRHGLDAELLRVDDAPPLVVAELRVAGAARTLNLYAHYDGQPVHPEQWHGDAFRPVLRRRALEEGGEEIDWRDPSRPLEPEMRLYARSAGDDKAPIVGLMAALEALRAMGEAPRSSLRFVFEGEEEAGSPHLAALLARYGDRLSADAWILCDGPVYQNRQPLVAFGARGVLPASLTVYGPLRGLHSGHYGNWAPNPIVRLTHLLDSMRDEEGRVRIAGFYDRVRPLSQLERASIAAAPAIDGALRDELGLAATEGEEPLELSIERPALNVVGIAGGGVGKLASATIVPAATAALEFRLVPDQSIERVRELLTAHLRRKGYFVVSDEPDAATRRAHAKVAKLVWGTGYPGARTSMNLPLSRQVVATLARVHEQRLVVLPMLGGSIPIHLFRGESSVPVVIVPIANHDDNQHSADENLRLANLWEGIETYAALLGGL